jgi:hypothetical protein
MKHRIMTTARKQREEREIEQTHNAEGWRGKHADMGYLQVE